VLDVAANVEIDFGSLRGRLVADGRQVVLGVEEPSALFGVADRRSLEALADGLGRAGLTLRISTGDRLLLLAGRDVKPGLVPRLLRLRNVQLDSRFALRAALARGLPRP